MRTAIGVNGALVMASERATGGAFACQLCSKGVRACRPTASQQWQFVHADGAACRAAAAPIEEAPGQHEADEGSEAEMQWKSAWEPLVRGEAKVELCSATRLRDEPEYFAQRNAAVGGRTLWIINARGDTLWKYPGCPTADGEEVAFCTDRVAVDLPTSDGTVVLFQCADGMLRAPLCEAACTLDIPEVGVRRVRLLTTTLSALTCEQLRECIDVEGECPFDDAEGEVHSVAAGGVAVVSVQGRLLFDGIHRTLFQRRPTAPLTVVQGPPGAGKTATLKKAVAGWMYARTQPRVLVVTFNKQNSVALAAELGGGTVTVCTLDSLCATPFKSDREKNRAFDSTNTDASLVGRFFPGSNTSHKIRCGGGTGCAELVGHRLAHPNAPARICKRHGGLTLSSGAQWSAALDEYPINEIVAKTSTFAARRYVCDRDRLLVAVFKRYDIVIADEMQDMLSAQEQRLLQQAACPLVLIGDVNQKVNDFRHAFSCKGCSKTPELECDLPAEAEPALPRCVEWYGTHRLDELTVAMLEDRTGVRMLSYRGEVEEDCIKWQIEPQYPNKTLVLCRTNESVANWARFNDEAMVVGGKKIAFALRDARRDNSFSVPMATFAHKLSQSAFDRLCELLCARSITLAEVAEQGCAAVSTVHQVKGFEYDHVAVHDDVMDVSTEAAIRFVALSRHRKSLTILNTPPFAGNEGKRTAQDAELDSEGEDESDSM